jgi:xylulokinase
MQSNNNEYLITFDIGTSAVKSGVYSFSTKEWKAVSRSNSYRIKSMNNTEIDPNIWWQEIINQSKKLQEMVPDLSEKTAAIAATGQMHCTLLLDKKGKPVRPAILMSDLRAEKEFCYLKNEMQSIYKISGARIDKTSVPAKLLWLRQNEPENFKRTAYILGVKDYLNFLMTDVISTDPTEAAGVLLYDMCSFGWSEELVRLINQDVIGLLPEIKPTCSVLGTLKNSAAEQLGLKTGIPVIESGGDDIEIYGSGLNRTGEAYEHLGTTGSLFILTNSRTLDSKMRLELYPDIVPGRYMLGGSVTSAGAATDWAEKIWGQRPEFSHIPEMLFLPFISGSRSPIWVPEARGIFYGISSQHEKKDFVEAVAVGVALSLKHIKEVLYSQGHNIETVYTTGFLGKNRDFAKWRAALYNGSILRYQVEEATLQGLAFISEKALGLTDAFHIVKNQYEWKVRKDDLHIDQVNLLRKLYQKYLKILDCL